MGDFRVKPIPTAITGVVSFYIFKVMKKSPSKIVKAASLIPLGVTLLSGFLLSQTLSKKGLGDDSSGMQVNDLDNFEAEANTNDEF